MTDNLLGLDGAQGGNAAIRQERQQCGWPCQTAG
jgi:hypothetical protein